MCACIRAGLEGRHVWTSWSKLSGFTHNAIWCQLSVWPWPSMHCCNSTFLLFSSFLSFSPSSLWWTCELISLSSSLGFSRIPGIPRSQWRERHKGVLKRNPCGVFLSFLCLTHLLSLSYFFFFLSAEKIYSHRFSIEFMNFEKETHGDHITCNVRCNISHFNKCNLINPIKWARKSTLLFQLDFYSLSCDIKIVWSMKSYYRN